MADITFLDLCRLRAMEKIDRETYATVKPAERQQIINECLDLADDYFVACANRGRELRVMRREAKDRRQ